MTQRVAALDCGTNSLRLLVADVDLDRAQMSDVARRMEIVRLGQDVDRTGRLAPEALAVQHDRSQSPQGPESGREAAVDVG